MKLIAYFPLVGRHSKLKRQRKALEDFVEMKRAAVCDEFVESEPGLSVIGRSFVELERAIAAAEKQKAYLLFVSLGRYAKNLNVLNLLAQSDAAFMALDNDHFTRKSLAAFIREAEEDMHQRIAKIRDGMKKAAKKKGEKYGSARPGHWTRRNNHLRGWKVANEVAVQRRAQRCADAYLPLIPIIAAGRKKGESFDAIAIALNEAGHVTLTGTPFSAPTVFKIFKRLGGENGRARRKRMGRQAATATAE